MTWPSQQIRKEETPEQRVIGENLYELTRSPVLGVVLLGCMEVVAVDHPDWTWWQVAKEALKRMAS
jgi:hypothetical protein